MAFTLPSTREPLLTGRFIALWCYSFVTFFSAFQLLPAIPFRILELGGTKAEAGWFLAAYTFASAFAAPVMGTFADHVGRQRMLVGASLLFILFSVAYGVLSSLPALLLVGAVHGALWSGILSSASAIMSGFIPASRRTQGMAWWGLAGTAAIAVAPAAGLMVFRRFDWLTLCLELAVLSAVMAVWGYLLPEAEQETVNRKPTLSETWDLPVTRAALSLTVVAFGYGGLTSYAAMLAIERNIRPDSLFFTVFAITLILVRVFTAHLGDRWGVKVMLYPSLAAIPLAFVLLALARTRWEMVLGAALFGFGFGWMYPAFVTFILGNTDPTRRARTFGSIVWAFDTGIGTGSLAIGAIAQRTSLRTAFLFAAVLACTSIPIFIATSKGLERVRN